MIPLIQLRDHVVQPALTTLGLYNSSACRLIIGTGLMESDYQYIAQVGGPALGPFQMEPETADDIWDNYLAFNDNLKSSMTSLMVAAADRVSQLAWNWQYAAAMCRIKYLRSPLPLPQSNDLIGMAAIWKQVYNTDQGAGDSQVFILRATNAGLLLI